MTNGQELAVCSRHDGWVSSCWFSSDSGLLVSVSNNIKVPHQHKHLCVINEGRGGKRAQVMIWS